MTLHKPFTALFISHFRVSGRVTGCQGVQVGLRRRAPPDGGELVGGGHAVGNAGVAEGGGGQRTGGSAPQAGGVACGGPGGDPPPWLPPLRSLQSRWPLEGATSDSTISNRRTIDSVGACCLCNMPRCPSQCVLNIDCSACALNDGVGKLRPETSLMAGSRG